MSRPKLKKSIRDTIMKLIEDYDVRVSIISLDSGGRHSKIVVRREADGAEKSYPFGNALRQSSNKRPLMNWICDLRRWANIEP